MKVLLIEDEPKMARSLKKGLEEHQIEVDAALDGALGYQLALDNEYAVIISDIILPALNGIDLLRQLRKTGNRTPVILLTALGQTDDKVSGFEAGADDYLTKPFEFRELLMRIRALARRPVDTYQSSPNLHFADLEMNLETREFFRQGQKIALTPREFSLM
jgi:two-component system copper resistance phosphate regulon response regulator CusR